MPARLPCILRRPYKPRNAQRRSNSSLSTQSPEPRFVLSSGSDPDEAGVYSDIGTDSTLKDVVRTYNAKVSPKAILRRSFSGIQPTGIPHLGNYLGALRQWKQLHDQARDSKFTARHHCQQYFSIVDLHALTSTVPGSERARLRKESYAALLAIGLRNDVNTTLFFQSEVSTIFFLFGPHN